MTKFKIIESGTNKQIHFSNSSIDFFVIKLTIN